MMYVLSGLIGLVVGALIAWVIVSLKISNKTASSLDEANQRTKVAENASSSM